MIYWTDTENGKIQRSSVDGTDVEELVSFGPVSPLGIVVPIWWENVLDRLRKPSGTAGESRRHGH
jgi:hypothetical protein